MIIDTSKLNELVKLREKTEQDVKDECLRLYKELYGVEIGSVVRCLESSKLYRVTDIDLDVEFVEYKPWVTGQYIRKDGFQTRKKKFLHRQWELVEK